MRVMCVLLMSVMLAGADGFVLKVSPGSYSREEGLLLRADTEKGSKFLRASASSYVRRENPEVIQKIMKQLREIGLTEEDAKLMDRLSKSIGPVQYELSYQVEGKEKVYRFEKRMGEDGYMEYFKKASQIGGPYYGVGEQKVRLMVEKLKKVNELLDPLVRGR
ncbi:hypothetical protein Rhal01_02107 [Rubritalea halochordaticola]|uniref:Uncharacterized protein n=1 Tax=Rubritalea halochordaticola TaxID=714537 RepID=A0ABP9UZQ6_9BACT